MLGTRRNSQTWPSASASDKYRRAEAARWIDRQPGDVDEGKVQREKGQPDDQPGHLERCCGIGGSENHNDEDQGGQELGQQRGPQLSFFEKPQPCLVGIEACASSHQRASGIC